MRGEIKAENDESRYSFPTRSSQHWATETTTHSDNSFIEESLRKESQFESTVQSSRTLELQPPLFRSRISGTSDRYYDHRNDQHSLESVSPVIKWSPETPFLRHNDTPTANKSISVSEIYSDIDRLQMKLESRLKSFSSANFNSYDSRY